MGVLLIYSKWSSNQRTFRWFVRAIVLWIIVKSETESTTMPMLEVSPEKIDFGNEVIPQRVYKETITITNTLSSTVVFSLRCSAPARLSVNPTDISLEAGESASFFLRLNVPASSAQRNLRTFRDMLFLQSTYFQQKIHVNFGIGVSEPKLKSAQDSSTTSSVFPAEVLHGSVSEARRSLDGGPTGYRALLEAEFEDKSEKVLRILQAKDEVIQATQLQAQSAQESHQKAQSELISDLDRL
jgi:hypothetical protein